MWGKNVWKSNLRSYCIYLKNHLKSLEDLAWNLVAYRNVAVWPLSYCCCYGDWNFPLQIQSLTDESRSSIRRKNHTQAQSSGSSNQGAALEDEMENEVANCENRAFREHHPGSNPHNYRAANKHRELYNTVKDEPFKSLIFTQKSLLGTRWCCGSVTVMVCLSSSMTPPIKHDSLIPCTVTSTSLWTPYEHKYSSPFLTLLIICYPSHSESFTTNFPLYLASKKVADGSLDFDPCVAFFCSQIICITLHVSLLV